MASIETRPRDFPFAPSPARDTLRRYAAITRLFDTAFRVPGTSVRFGLDSILGLVPGAGDVIAAMAGAYGVLLAREIGAPASVQIRMLWNLIIDTTIGAIPILGDLFDIAFKAHVRNQRLLENWLARPQETRRSSTGLLVLMGIAFLALVTGVVWLGVVAVQALFRLFA